MGLFKALIVIVIGMFTLSLLEDKNSKLNNIPIISTLFSDKIKKNKAIIVVLVIALYEFLI
jgi:hypothetical protein